ncbi:hypothetical protein J2Z21_007978 [Streptomyces griseochromogenes]|uniref:Uncharacterized protein n=1 Tax=Streptomyces griseochromogenes TaxID=68214 RepID=A0ABS4M5L9_9ACTN|nr:hypothetical protein [Streptomyces griseochromogenes]
MPDDAQAIGPRRPVRAHITGPHLSTPKPREE